MILLSRNYHFAESHECAFLCEIEATASRPCPDFQVIAHVSVTRVTRARDAANFMAVLRRILKGATIIPPAGGIPDLRITRSLLHLLRSTLSVFTRLTSAGCISMFAKCVNRVIPAGPQMGGKPIEAGHFGIRS